MDINEKDIKFFKLNQNPIYKDVFDINGHFRDAEPTRLAINGADKIGIGQFKPDVLRIVLSNKKNLNTSYTVNKKQIIISVNETSIKKDEDIYTPKVNNSSLETKNEQNFDLENSIRSMETQNNKIIIKEFTKTLMTKEVDSENKEGFFLVYKRVINRIEIIIEEVNPAYPFAKSLASSVVEGTLHQHFLKDHLKTITNLSDQDCATEFYLDMIKKTLL